MRLNLQLNNDVKNPSAPATLKFPQYKAQLIIGSVSENSDQNAPAKISLHQPQVLRFLKILERIGVFNEFRDGAVSDFLKRKLTQQDKQKYLDAFLRYLKATNELSKDSTTNKKEHQKQADKSRKEMRAIEDQVDHVQIVEIREQGHKQFRNEDEYQSELD